MINSLWADKYKKGSMINQQSRNNYMLKPNKNQGYTARYHVLCLSSDDNQEETVKDDEAESSDYAAKTIKSFKNRIGIRNQGYAMAPTAATLTNTHQQTFHNLSHSTSSPDPFQRTQRTLNSPLSCNSYIFGMLSPRSPTTDRVKALQTPPMVPQPA